MALGILAVIATFAILLSVVLIIVLLYKDGHLAQNNSVFILIQVYLVLLAGMQVTAVPSNDLMGKALGYGIFIVTLLALYIKKKNFFAARMMLALMLVLAPFLLFWG